MTYLADETAHKQPIELYQFTISGAFTRYTDNEVAYVHPITGQTYSPEAVSRGELQISEEDNSNSVDVTVDALSDIGNFFRNPFLPTRSVFLLIERTHPGAVDAPALVFRGQVATCQFSGGTAKLTCIPTRQALQRMIPTVMVQSLCPNTLYDQRCLVNPASFQVTGLSITVISGTTVTVPGHGKPDGYFSGGTLTQGALPPVTIREQTGNVFRLLYNYGLTVAGGVTLLPGCDKKYSTCGLKFVNTTHFQVFPNMPVIDPFVDAIN